MTRFQDWKFKNTILLVISLILLYISSDIPEIKALIKTTGDMGYLGAFIAGLFFVSIFTVAPAIIIILFISTTHNIILVSVLAGIGAMLGDYLIFKYLKDNILAELRPLLNYFGKPLVAIFHSKHFSWIIPIVAMAAIASPVPDEVGISMLSISKIKSWHFVSLTFILNSIGIFIIIKLSQL